MARRSGVSTTTVSYILNGKEDRMSEKTVQKVKLAASELMYSPNGLIRALRSRRTGTIGFCYPVPLDYTNPYIAMMFDGVRAGAEESNFDVLIYGNRGKQPGNLDPAVFLDGRIDGLVFWPGLRPSHLGPLVECRPAHGSALDD